MASAHQLIDIASRELGVKESPAGSNRQPYGVAFGENAVAWCAIYVWYVFTQARVALPLKTAGVYALLTGYKSQGKFGRTPMVGSPIFFSWGQGHVGIVTDVHNSRVTFISGNTSASDGTSSNGGEVALHTINVGNSAILGYGYPDFSNTPPPPSPTPAPIPAPTSGDAVSDALVVQYNNGSKIIVSSNGSVFTAGTGVFYGSMSDLKPEQKQGVSSIVAATAVDPNNPAAGYVLYSQAGNPYRFDSALWKSLGH